MDYIKILAEVGRLYVSVGVKNLQILAEVS